MKLKKCNIYDNNYEESLYWVITWNFLLSEGGRNFSGKGMNIFFWREKRLESTWVDFFLVVGMSKNLATRRISSSLSSPIPQ